MQKKDIETLFRKTIDPLTERISQVEIDVASLKPQGFGKTIKWLRDIGALAIIVAAFMGLVAITLGAVYQAYAKVEQRARFEENVTNTLKSIQSDLAALKAFSGRAAKQTIEDIVRLDQPEFSKRLETLRRAIGVLPPSERLDPTIAGAVLAKLRQADSSSPDYWPAVFQFVSFTSATQASKDVPPPGPPTVKLASLTFDERAAGFGLRDSVVLLDGGELSNSKFLNSRIIFTNNRVRLANVEFVNCVFEFPETITPTQYLQSAGRQLLAARDLSTVTMSL